MTPIELILICLATARLTRLTTTDTLLDSPRAWLLTKLTPLPKIQYLVTCDWCASMYTGAITVGGYLAWHGNMWFMGFLAVLAASYVTGALASVTGGE